jgi:hypothetical protein
MQGDCARVHSGFALNLPSPTYSGIHEYEFTFIALANIGFESRCGLDIWNVSGQMVVMLTELPDNPGASVTNAFECIATEVLPMVVLLACGESCSPESVIWIEHYARAEGSPLAESWDRVRLQWNGVRYHSPEREPWERMFAG